MIRRHGILRAKHLAGWIGCNIALNQIPPDARIHVIKNRAVTPASDVREQFRKVKPLADVPIAKRGWTLDVLNIVRRLGKTEFSNADVYAFASELEKLHPDNRHIKDKIRQQLQTLRDAGLLAHPARDSWQIR